MIEYHHFLGPVIVSILVFGWAVRQMIKIAEESRDAIKARSVEESELAAKYEELQKFVLSRLASFENRLSALATPTPVAPPKPAAKRGYVRRGQRVK